MQYNFERLRTAQRTLLDPNLSEEQRERQYESIANARDAYSAALADYETHLKDSQLKARFKEFQNAIADWKVENDKFFDAMHHIEEEIHIADPSRLLAQLEGFRADHYALTARCDEAILDKKLFEGGEDGPPQRGYPVRG